MWKTRKDRESSKKEDNECVMGDCTSETLKDTKVNIFVDGVIFRIKSKSGTL